jgi:hypothetical protein
MGLKIMRGLNRGKLIKNSRSFRGRFSPGVLSGSQVNLRSEKRLKREAKLKEQSARVKQPRKT